MKRIFLIMIAFGVCFFEIPVDAYEKSLKNKEREVFKSSKPYTENMAQTLNSYKMQYDLASPEDKKIIANNIKIEFANMNPALIENPNLRYFLNDIMGGNL